MKASDTVGPTEAAMPPKDRVAMASVKTLLDPLGSESSISIGSVGGDGAMFTVDPTGEFGVEFGCVTRYCSIRRLLTTSM